MSQIVIYIMIASSIIAGLDKIFGNKLGLGEHFVKGFNSMGSLALTILGIYTIAPLIGNFMLIVLKPITKLTGIDPSIFIGTILAPDMGGYNTSVLIASSEKIGMFSGLILSSMIGATIVFTVPVAIGIISKDDYPYFAKGILCGLITVPFGSLLSGIMMGIPVLVLLLNHIPIIIFSAIISIGLYKTPKNMFKLFSIFGKMIVTISMLGLLLSILDFTLGIQLVKGLVPIEEGFIIVGQIAIILSGAYPLIHLASTKLNRYFNKVGKYLRINDTSVLGLITSLANSIPMLMLYKDMDHKGKIVNAAFAVGATFTFGGQLGFVSGVAQNMVIPFLVGKLTAGATALVLAIIILRNKNIEVSTN